MAGDGTALLETIHRRERLLRRLATEAARPDQLAADLDAARSTIDRGLAELEAVDLIECVDDGYRTTVAGGLALATYDRLVDGLADVAAARSLLGSVPADAGIDPRLVDGATIVLDENGRGGEDDGDAPRIDVRRADPAAALDRLLETGSRHRVYVPALATGLVETVAEAIQAGTAVEVTLTTDARERLLDDFRRAIADASATGRLTLFETATAYPYAIVVVEYEDADATGLPFDRDGETDGLVVLVVCENGSIRGLVANDRQPALEWATTKLAAIGANAEELVLADRS